MAKSGSQDEILYCARCGISFLWAQEEQKADVPSPIYCPGCRQLLPAPGRERGVVKWYDPRKQYGFLVRPNQPELYVHRSGIEQGQMLKPDDLVEFVVVMTPRGPAAEQVTVLESEGMEIENGK